MMAPSLVLQDGRPRLVVGSAGSARLRAPSFRSSSMRLATGCPSKRRSALPVFTSTTATSTAREVMIPPSSTSSTDAATTSPRRNLGAPLVETGRTPAEEAMESSSMAERIVVRRARPGDAGALVELAEAVASEPEGWLISDGLAHARRGAAVPARAAPLRRRCSVRRRGPDGRDRRQARSAATRIRRAGMSPTSASWCPPAIAGEDRNGSARLRSGRGRSASASSSCTSFRTTTRRSSSTRAAASAERASGAAITAAARVPRRGADGARRPLDSASGHTRQIADSFSSRRFATSSRTSRASPLRKSSESSGSSGW